jgi:hypothetical protein
MTCAGVGWNPLLSDGILISGGAVGSGVLTYVERMNKNVERNAASVRCDLLSRFPA